MANRSIAHMALLRRDGACRARARTRPRRGRILPAVAGNATVEARGRGRAAGRRQYECGAIQRARVQRQVPHRDGRAGRAARARRRRAHVRQVLAARV